MPAFLVLLPLALTNLLIGLLLVSNPQTNEYVRYVSGISLNSMETRFVLQIAVHLLAYAVMCFALVATVHTVSSRLSADRQPLLRYFQALLEIAFAALPSALLAALIIIGLTEGGTAWDDLLRPRQSHWVLWLCLGVALAGLILKTIIVRSSRIRLELFRSTWRPLSLKLADLLGAACVVAIIGTFVFLWTGLLLGNVRGAQFLGAFPVLFLSFSTVLLVIAAVLGGLSSPIPVISIIVSAVLLLQIVDITVLPTRQFRYTAEMPQPPTGQRAAGVRTDADDVLRHREIPKLASAFEQWLKHRQSAIAAYKSQGKAYPVFVVAVQGGGIYAAYHSAMSLARLQDACPEFARHAFAISSVSGGSLGAALFTELLRSLAQGQCRPNRMML